MKSIMLALAAMLALSARPAAADDADGGAQRWADLRHAIFGDRAVQDGSAEITLEAPARALDAALVPISVTLAHPLSVAALYIVIDNNPSPLAGTFHFGPAVDARALKLRVRVDQYTLMHAVAETRDGRLYEVERFIKAAGGCSAPSSADQATAMQRLGRMKLRILNAPAADGSATAELLISHPNANGMQMDQVTRLYTPARFIQTVRVTEGNVSVFDLDADISLSEDPAITFGLRPINNAPLNVEVDDSAKAVFRQSFPIPPNAS